MSQDILDTMIGAGGVTADPQAAQEHFAQAVALEEAGNRLEAVEEYRKAVQLGSQPQHIFRLAYLLDLLGEENESIGLYEQLIHNDRPHVNALLNLAVLYEDRGEIAKAEKCLRQILDTAPNHERASMYMKDVQASRNMYYDEEQARNLDRHRALLDTPVTDFELSVRARNCLKKMQIRTLGDLLKISEAELLSYKNFGETSLNEIKLMLSSKALRLGQGWMGSTVAPVRKFTRNCGTRRPMPCSISRLPRLIFPFGPARLCRFSISRRSVILRCAPRRN